MNLNKRVDELRLALGFETVAEFAHYIDYKRSTLHYNLSGHSEPKVVLVEKLLEKVKNLNPYWLILGQGSMLLEEGKGLPSLVDEADELRMEGQVKLLKELLASKEAEIRELLLKLDRLSRASGKAEQ